MTHTNRTTSLLLILAIMLLAAPAHAAVFSWDGQLASNNWNASSGVGGVDTNWDVALLIPGPLDNVVFPDTAADFSVDLNGNRTVIGATFSGVSNYTLNNNTLTLGSGDLTATGSATHTINSGVTLGASGTWLIDDTSTVDINGSLSGAFDLTKTGTGTLVLGGGNAGYTNDITVAEGTLQAGDSNSLSDATNVQVDAGATLQIVGGESFGGISGAGDVVLNANAQIGLNDVSTIISGHVSGVGNLQKSGTGTLTLTGVNAYLGGTVLNGGIIAVGADNNLGASDGPLTFDGGDLRFESSFDLDADRSITLRISR